MAASEVRDAAWRQMAALALADAGVRGVFAMDPGLGENTYPTMKGWKKVWDFKGSGRRADGARLGRLRSRLFQSWLRPLQAKASISSVTTLNRVRVA